MDRILRTIFFSGMAVVLASFSPLRAESITEAKIQEATVSLSPELEFMLPSGAIDISLHHTVGPSGVNFLSQYDFINNYIHTDLDFFYAIRLYLFGIDLADNVDFDNVLMGQSTVQRSRHIKPYVGYTIAGPLRLMLSTKFGNNYTVSIDQQTTFDSGKSVTPGIGLLYNTLDESQNQPKGTRASLDFSRSISVLGGDYDYTQVDLSVDDVSYPYDAQFLRTRFKAGYPLSMIRKPLTDLYALGGYELLRGYKYREFQGDSLLYLRLGYSIPLPKIASFPGGVIDIASWDVDWEIAKVGDKHDIIRPEDFKSSMGIGASCVLTLFKVLKVKFNANVSQAMELRNPVFYFGISAVSYTHK